MTEAAKLVTTDCPLVLVENFSWVPEGLTVKAHHSLVWTPTSIRRASAAPAGPVPPAFVPAQSGANQKLIVPLRQLMLAAAFASRQLYASLAGLVLSSSTALVLQLAASCKLVARIGSCPWSPIQVLVLNRQWPSITLETLAEFSGFVPSASSWPSLRPS